MSLEPLIAAFRFPPESLLRLRLAKRYLSRRAATAEGDATLIDTLVERAEWYAALRPAQLGIPTFSDATRDYPEIAVVSLTLRARPTKTELTRLQGMLHTAVAKPLLLLFCLPPENTVALSLAHKSRHARDTTRRVADTPRHTGWFSAETPDPACAALLGKLAPTPGTSDLFALYSGWITALTDLEVALRLGVADASPAATSTTPEADLRTSALTQLAGLDRDLARLRSAMAKAKTAGERSALVPEINRLLTLKTSLEEKLR